MALQKLFSSALDYIAPKPEIISEDELDLSHIIPNRLIAVGRPWGGPTSTDTHHNDVHKLGAYLKQKYGRRNCMVFNLSVYGHSSKCKQLRGAIDYSELCDDMAAEFPPVLGNDDVKPTQNEVPSISQVFSLCYCLKFWLEWNPQHVAVVFCGDGILRTGFMIACFLAYIGFQGMTSTRDTFRYFLQRRLGQDSHELWVSWHFALHLFDKLVETPEPKIPAILFCQKIRLTLKGAIQDVREHAPFVCIFQDGVCIFHSARPAVGMPNLRGTSDPPALRKQVQQTAMLDVDWEDGVFTATVNRLLTRDVQIYIYSFAVAPDDSAFNKYESGIPVAYDDYVRRVQQASVGPSSADSGDGSLGSAARELSPYLLVPECPSGFTSWLVERAESYRDKGLSPHLIGRFGFHSWQLGPARSCFGKEQVDVLKRGLVDIDEFNLELCLDDPARLGMAAGSSSPSSSPSSRAASPVPAHARAMAGRSSGFLDQILPAFRQRHAALVSQNSQPHSHINLRGAQALLHGVRHMGVHHVLQTEGKAFQRLSKEGFEQTAIVCALQCTGNSLRDARKLLSSGTLFQLGSAAWYEEELQRAPYAHPSKGVSSASSATPTLLGVEPRGSGMTRAAGPIMAIAADGAKPHLSGGPAGTEPTGTASLGPAVQVTDAARSVLDSPSTAELRDSFTREELYAMRTLIMQLRSGAALSHMSKESMHGDEDDLQQLSLADMQAILRAAASSEPATELAAVQRARELSSPLVNAVTQLMNVGDHAFSSIEATAAQFLQSSSAMLSSPSAQPSRGSATMHEPTAEATASLQLGSALSNALIRKCARDPVDAAGQLVDLAGPDAASELWSMLLPVVAQTGAPVESYPSFDVLAEQSAVHRSGPVAVPLTTPSARVAHLADMPAGWQSPSVRELVSPDDARVLLRSKSLAPGFCSASDDGLASADDNSVDVLAPQDPRAALLAHLRQRVRASSAGKLSAGPASTAHSQDQACTPSQRALPSGVSAFEEPQLRFAAPPPISAEAEKPSGLSLQDRIAAAADARPAEARPAEARPAEARLKDAGSNAVALGEHPDFGRFFKMLKMGVPPPAVALKLEAELSMEGVLPECKPGVSGAQVLACDAGQPLPPELRAGSGAEDAGSNAVALGEHPDFGRFFKMLKMGVPPPAVALKLEAELSIEGVLPECKPGVSGAQVLACDAGQPLPPELRAGSGAGGTTTPVPKPVKRKRPREPRRKFFFDPPPELPGRGPGALARLGDTVWVGNATDSTCPLLEHGLSSRAFSGMDYKIFRALFAKSAASSATRRAQATSAAKQRADVPTGVSLLDPKRSMAVGIAISRITDLTELLHTLSAPALPSGVFLQPWHALQALAKQLYVNHGMGAAVLSEQLQKARTAVQDAVAEARRASPSPGVDAGEYSTLGRVLPTSEEVATVQRFAGARSELAAPEQLIARLADIPQFAVAMRGYSHLAELTERAADVLRWLSLIITATTAVRNSVVFRRLLQVGLVLGNAMNCADPLLLSASPAPEGSSACAADAWHIPDDMDMHLDASQAALRELLELPTTVYAFGITSLSKLSTVKSFDGSTTALQFLVANLHAQNPDELTQLHTMLRNVREASFVTWDVVREELASLRDGNAQLEQAEQHWQQCKAAIAPDMQAALASAQALVSDTVRAHQIVESAYSEFVQWLAGVADDSPSALFGQLASVGDAIQAAQEVHLRKLKAGAVEAPHVQHVDTASLAAEWRDSSRGMRCPGQAATKSSLSTSSSMSTAPPAAPLPAEPKPAARRHVKRMSAPASELAARGALFASLRAAAAPGPDASAD